MRFHNKKNYSYRLNKTDFDKKSEILTMVSFEALFLLPVIQQTETLVDNFFYQKEKLQRKQ